MLMIATGFPTRMRDTSFVEGCDILRMCVQSTNDEFGPLDEWRTFIETLPEPKQIVTVEATDHFFDGGLTELEEAIRTLD